MRHTTPTCLILASLAGCYSTPLRDKDDRFFHGDLLNGITGSIQLRGPTEPDDAMVLVFDANNPGPPEGTSGPVDFAVVRAEEFQGEPVYGYRAEFAVTDVPDGEYLVDVILDVDGDFSPGAFTLGGATCDDWQGSHFGLNQAEVTTTLDTGGGTPAVYGKGRVVVEGGTVMRGVAVDVAERLTTERPAFVFKDEAGFARISLTTAGTAPVPPSYTLKSSGIHVRFTDEDPGTLELAEPCQLGTGADARFCAAQDTCDGAFSVFYRDADGNGLMDPHPDYPTDFGLKDVWPRVFLEYLGTAELDGTGTPVLDENGYPKITPPTDLEEGEFWGGENFPFAVEATFGIPMAPVGTPTKMPEISVLFPPLVAKFHADGSMELFDLKIEEQRAAVPRGIWGVNLISWTGQTWGLPNEISGWGLPSSDATGTFDPKLQGGFLLTVD